MPTQAVVRERPILFSSPMVRAILEGRKTQTRRALKEPGWAIEGDSELEVDEHGKPICIAAESGCFSEIPCPYGKRGDRLWVRETYLFDDCFYINKPMPKTPPNGWREAFYYRADGECCEQIPECACAELEGKTPWRPSIFMPRWASRITLEITDVRVQRLQEISERDAKAEGCSESTVPAPDTLSDPNQRALAKAMVGGTFTARLDFMMLWDSINAKRGFGWATNPWVWALTFRRLP